MGTMCKVLVGALQRIVYSLGNSVQMEDIQVIDTKRKGKPCIPCKGPFERILYPYYG